MDNKHCERCGEEYSGTYRRCPFCQEIAAERRGRPMYRSGKRLSPKQRAAGAFGVTKIVAAAVVVCVALVFFFGDDMAQFLGIRTQHQSGGNTQQDTQQNHTPDDSQSGENTQGGEDTQGGEAGNNEEQPGGDVIVEPLSLSQSAITIPVGETARIDAIGGSGEIVWTSSNENIAIVVDGAVTGVAGGTVTITATAGEEQVTCTVTITGDPWSSGVELSLNYTDFTLREGDPAVKMKVKGTDSIVIWTSSNTNVATIDSDGVVRRVGRGTCTITAEVDGQKLTCIVRVA